MLIIQCLQIIHFPPALCLGSEENCNLHIFIPSAGVCHCFYDINHLYNIKTNLSEKKNMVSYSATSHQGAIEVFYPHFPKVPKFEMILYY